MWQRCICGLLRERGSTVVFVTHHVHWLASCDHVIRMDAGGLIKEQGTPSVMRRYNSTPALAEMDAKLEIQHPSSLLDTGEAAGGKANGEAEATGEKKKPAAANIIQAPLTPHPLDAAVWARYFKALGKASVLVLFLLYSAAQTLQIGSSWWLGQWSGMAHHSNPNGDGGLPFVETTWFYLSVYAGITLTAACLILVRSLVLTLATLRASKAMHKMASHAVIAAPIEFFDTNPLGRILNRFSVDMQVIDVQLSPVAGQLLIYCFQLIGTLTLLILNSPFIIIGVLPLSLLYLRVAFYYRHSSVNNHNSSPFLS
ncbi:MAG: hypothetical protein SGPRY_001118 [Prymnesium sp.]